MEPLTACWVQILENEEWKIAVANYKKITAAIGNEVLEVLSGIREGGLSSPTFFNCGTNDLVKKCKDKGVGFTIGFIILCILLFADDIVLIADTPEKLQILLDENIKGDFPSFQEIQKLGYIRKVINESLRLSPPVWLITRKTIKEDILGGHRVKPGQMIIFSPYI